IMLKHSLVVLLLVAASFSQSSNKKPPANGPQPAASSGTIVLRGGKLLTITHGVIENGALVIQNGKITAVGAAGSTAIPDGAKVIDVTGMTVYPGLIDSETHLGLTEIAADRSTNDTLENSDEI